MKFHLISLGCTKNTADSEVIANSFASAGWLWAEKPELANLILINTCGFIKDAKEESLATIMNNLSIKDNHPDVRVCVFGCLVKRYRAEIQNEIPEIDYLFEFLSEDQLKMLVSLNSSRLPPDYSQSWRFFTPPHIGILKIAEGCSNRCSTAPFQASEAPFTLALRPKFSEMHINWQPPEQKRSLL
jgi:ribosomal protein S12 methylthiotransferase